MVFLIVVLSKASRSRSTVTAARSILDGFGGVARDLDALKLVSLSPLTSGVFTTSLSILQHQRTQMTTSLVGAPQLASQIDCFTQTRRHYHHSHDSQLMVTSVIKSQMGGSQSRLVTCDDGRLYVLKMHPNPQGPNVLANETLGSILLRGLGFFAPRWRQVTINLKALRLFPDLAMCTAGGGTSFPACGVHFGSEYLGGPRYHVYDFMPKARMHTLRNASQLLPIYLFDVWANHQDKRQCIYQKLLADNLYDTFFIDNGHLFGGPTWQRVADRPRTSQSDIIEPIRIEDPRVEQCLKLFEERIPKLLHRAVAIVPPEWYKDDIYALYARLMWRLDFLRLLVAGDILDKDQRETGFGSSDGVRLE